MADTVKLPGMGNVKKQYVYIGGALIAGIAGYAWWRYLQAGGSASADVAVGDTTGTDGTTDTTDYYGTDSMALAPYDTSALDYAYGSDYAGSLSPYEYYGTDINGSTYVQPPSTNYEWTQAAISVLSEYGTDTSPASSAISKFILNECLTSAEADIVRQAVASLGNPPQGLHNIIICPASGGGSTTTPPSSAMKTSHVSGLKVTKRGKSYISLDWSPVTGAAGYTIWVNGARKTTTRFSNYSIAGLSKNKNYRITVAAIDSQNKYAPGTTGTTINAKTTK